MRARDLRGATVVITGASSGVGRGAALALAREGAHVVLAARREDVLDQPAADIISAGGRAIVVPTDVASYADVRALAARAIEEFGHIDVWINGVGIGAVGLFWKVPVESHTRTIDVNLTGVVHGSHVALSHFAERRAGVLLNVGSVESSVPVAYQSSYAATKAGVLSLGRALNEELRKAGLAGTVRVGTILPWALNTPWWAHAANYSGRRPRMPAMDDPAIVVRAIVAACVRPREARAVGWKARGALLAHRAMPRLADRIAAEIVHRTLAASERAPDTTGAIHRPATEPTYGVSWRAT